MPRQRKPESDTKVFDLGFSFAKIRFYLRFSIVGVPRFILFGVRIALSVAVADGFMPRKVLGRQKGVCQATGRNR